MTESDRQRRWSIGEAAAQTGVSVKTIRYYEQSGLIPPAVRGLNGYRQYEETALHRLRFVRRARDMGFPLREVRSLLALWSNEQRSSSDVRTVAEQHLRQVEAKIEQLQALRRTLDRLIHQCAGDDRPQCPILDDLASLGCGG